MQRVLREKKLLSFFSKRPKTSLYLGAIFLSFLSLFFVQKERPSSSSDPSFLQEGKSLDTFIPRGFVLVPIAVENPRSLESALGGYGIVDLYASSDSRPDQFELIVKNIQILKSPYPPYEFAVISPEEKAKFLLQFNGLFKVAVKNPKKTGMHFEKEPRAEKTRKIKRKIFIDSDE